MNYLRIFLLLVCFSLYSEDYAEELDDTEILEEQEILIIDDTD